MAVRTFTAVIYWESGEDDEDGVYVAECPEIGTASQGDTIEEALANLREATELYLEESPTLEGRHPFVTTFEVQNRDQPGTSRTHSTRTSPPSPTPTGSSRSRVIVPCHPGWPASVIR